MRDSEKRLYGRMFDDPKAPLSSAATLEGRGECRSYPTLPLACWSTLNRPQTVRFRLAINSYLI